MREMAAFESGRMMIGQPLRIAPSALLQGKSAERRLASKLQWCVRLI
jgi:hypothetical protein